VPSCKARNGRVDTFLPAAPARTQGITSARATKSGAPARPLTRPYGGQRYAYEKAGRDFCNFSENATTLIRQGLSLEAATEKILGQVRSNFSAFLGDRKAGQPFCYWFGPTLTHRAYEKDSGKALWGIEPDSSRANCQSSLPTCRKCAPISPITWGKSRRGTPVLVCCFRSCEEIGELDNTLVVVSGDHGMPGVPGGKCNLYDFGVAVALIAAGAWSQRRTRRGRLREPYGPRPDLP